MWSDIRKSEVPKFLVLYVIQTESEGARVLATLLSGVENKPEIHFYVTLHTCPIIIRISGQIRCRSTNNYKIAAGLDENSVILIQQKDNEHFEVIEYIENLSHNYIIYFNYY